MNGNQDRYIVWRRSDGHVGTITYVPRPDRDVTFEVLLDTSDWPEARKRIKAERAKAGQS